MGGRECAETGGADQDPDQDETNDRADPEAGERRDDDSGRAENDERVAEPGSAEVCFHRRSLPSSDDWR